MAIGFPGTQIPAEKTHFFLWFIHLFNIQKKNPDPKKKTNWLSFGITKYIFLMNLERTADVTFFQNYLYTCNNVGTCRCKSRPKIHVGNDYSSYLSANAVLDKSCLTSRISLVYDQQSYAVGTSINCIYLVGFT